MAKILCSAIYFILLISEVFSQDFYYLNSSKNCSIRFFNNGNLQAVSDKDFLDKPYNIKSMSKNSKLVAFKQSEKVYVTDSDCMINATDYFAILKSNNKISTPKVKHNTFYVELEAGFLFLPDRSPVVEDYNLVLPNTTASKWLPTSKHSYNANSAITIGVGYKFKDKQYIVFKYKSIYGKKTDQLSVYDIATSTSQAGSWVYSDSFQNYYLGYRKFFNLYFFNVNFKTSWATLLGYSFQNSTLSDSNREFNLTSANPSFLAEIGVEYIISHHFSLCLDLGFEYLGTRNLKFAEAGNHKDFKSNFSYNNFYQSMGMKLYF